MLCSASGCDIVGTKLCGQCQRSKYCSSECQKKDWSGIHGHKTECVRVEDQPITDDFCKLLKADRLYACSQLLASSGGLSQKQRVRLQHRWDQTVALGIHHEIVGDRIALQPVEGKGLGYVAVKPISHGDVLLFDTAFVSWPYSAKENRNSMDEAREVMHRGTQNTDPIIQEFYQNQVLRLFTGIDRSSTSNEMLIVMDIIDKNSFQCSAEPDRSALYVKASRFNHSCIENAFVDGTSQRAIVRALSDISVGEEVTVGYLSSLEMYSARHAALLKRGFECKCPRCENERKVDPRESCRCSCGLDGSIFSLRLADSHNGRPCSACGKKFDFKEGLRRLQLVKDTNGYMLTQQATAENPTLLAMRMEKVLASSREPPMVLSESHIQMIALLNNLANAYFFVATRMPGDTSKAMASFVRHKISTIDNSLKLTNGKPWMNGLSSLTRLLCGKFRSKKQRVRYEEMLKDHCLAFFGQPTPPPRVIEPGLMHS